jgi:hypothetical protein
VKGSGEFVRAFFLRTYMPEWLSQKVAGEGEESRSDKRGVECGGGWLWPTEWARAKGSAIALGGGGQCKGEKQDEERIQVESFAQMAVEERCEGSRGAAAGAFDVQELVDGAGGVETCLCRWKEEERGTEEHHRSEDRVGQDSAAEQ